MTSVPCGTPAARMPGLRVADDAVGDQQVAVHVEIARRIDDARVGEQDTGADHAAW